jgi:hypothetical protein
MTIWEKMQNIGCVTGTLMFVFTATVCYAQQNEGLPPKPNGSNNPTQEKALIRPSARPCKPSEVWMQTATPCSSMVVTPQGKLWYFQFWEYDESVPRICTSSEDVKGCPYGDRVSYVREHWPQYCFVTTNGNDAMPCQPEKLPPKPNEGPTNVGGIKSPSTTSGMIRSDSIGNDPDKERLCISRCQQHSFCTNTKIVPFMIDPKYVARIRAWHPDVTFIATDNGQLVECFLREGTGRYEPDGSSGDMPYWHLIKPPQFDPGINTVQGSNMAVNACLNVAKERISHPNFDHSVSSSVVEINDTSTRLVNPQWAKEHGLDLHGYTVGALIAGQKAERYDITIEGTSFYRPKSGPDLDAINFRCLFSPMLELKGFQVIGK